MPNLGARRATAGSEGLQYGSIAKILDLLAQRHGEWSVDGANPVDDPRNAAGLETQQGPLELNLEFSGERGKRFSRHGR
jgi:hypothetical protein